MKKTIISLVVLSALSVSAHANDTSHLFDKTVSTREAAKEANTKALADYNSPKRFNVGSSTSFNQTVVDAAETAQQEKRDAENAVNGVNYRTQVTAQQRNQKAADAKIAHDAQIHQATFSQAAADALANSRKASAMDARVKRADSAVKQETAVRKGEALTQANVARTRQEAVGLADARQAEADRQAKALAEAQAQHAKDIANYGVKRVATATYSEQPHTVTYSGVSIRPNTGATINVAANSLKPDTNVQVTDTAGHKSVVKASTLTPSTQVSIPFHSAFQHTVKGGKSHETASSHVEHGTGAGADNEHDHAFGGHTGAGGGFHM